MPVSQHLISRFILSSPATYDTSHTQRIEQHLIPGKALKPAAVLIPLVIRDDGIHIIFTRRAKHLKHHPGQVSFPGGRYEVEDGDLIDTAIRETHEETGILCNRSNIVGQLPSLATISGYIVTPYLSVIPAQYTPYLDPNEVDELFEAPASFVLNPMNMATLPISIKGQKHHIYSVSFGKYAIWGATAQMLKVLSKQLWHEKN